MTTETTKVAPAAVSHKLKDDDVEQFLEMISADIFKFAAGIAKVEGQTMTIVEIGDVLIRILRRFPRRGWDYVLKHVVELKSKLSKRAATAEKPSVVAKAAKKSTKKIVHRQSTGKISDAPPL